MVKNGKWLPLFTTQFLGVLNDNVLKNAIIFISILWLAEDYQDLVYSIAPALLVLPFVLLSPLAGKWSQTKSKQKIFEIAKLMEIPIMAIAVLGFFMESIYVVMFSMLLMGIQSAIYSPSKYGLIRDIGGVEGVSFGIGTMELLTFMGVVIGQILTGLISDFFSNSVLIIGVIMLVLAIVGWFSSKKIFAEEPKPTKDTGETINPVKYLYESYNWSKSIKGLNYTILGIGGFWLVAALLQMNIYVHTLQYYEMSNTQTAIVLALLLTGIGTGCWVAGVIAKNRVEIGMVPIGGIGLSFCLTILATTELSSTNFTILLFIAAFFSGFYKIPLNAWLQQRVEGRKLGNILAYNNMVLFLFILLASAIFGLVSSYFDTTAVFIFIAVISWIMTIITLLNIPAMMIRFIADAIAKLYFKYDIRGVKQIPQKSGGLLIANHQSLIDPLIIVATIPRMVRFVMAREIYENPFIHWFVKRMNVIPVTSNIGKGRLEEFTRLCQEEINKGHLVCIFPEGQISRIGHLLEFKKGVEHIAEGIDAPIIPIHLAGIQGTPFSFDVGSSKPVINFSSFRKSISVSIGKPIYHQQSAFHLRQRIQELTAVTFERRIKSHHTLGHFFSKVAKNNACLAISNTNGTQYSYADLFNKASKLSAYLSSRFGNLERVGVYAQSGTDAMLLNTSLAMAGITSININPDLDEEQLQEVYEKCEVLIADVQLKPSGSEHVTFYQMKDILAHSDYIKKAIVKEKTAVKGIIKNDVVTIVFEQNERDQWVEIGLTHQNILASVKGLMQIFSVQQAKRVLSAMPLYTAYGYSLKLWLPLLTGMTIIHTDRVDDARELIRTISKQKVDILFANDQLVHQLYAMDKSEVWLSIDTIVTGRDAVEPEIQDILHQDFKVDIHESIGFTDYGAVIAVSSPNYELKDIAGKPIAQTGSKTNSYGRPIPGIAVKVVDPDHHDIELGPNEVGAMLIKGASLSTSSNGYSDEHLTWQPSGYKGVIDQDGFLKLGKELLN